MDKIKVLFIDDDIDFGKMLSLALEENGIKVYYSNSLAGIVAAIKEISPNIILLDVEIGTQSGIDTLPQIKAVALHTPILFVSSHHESEVAIQAIQKGGLNYLRKPFEIDELLAYIYRYVNVQCNNELLFEQFTLDIEKRLLKRNGATKEQIEQLRQNKKAALETYKSSQKAGILRNLRNKIQIESNQYGVGGLPATSKKIKQQVRARSKMRKRREQE